jgi:hypothetical protein
MAEVRIEVRAGGSCLTFIVDSEGSVELVESVQEPGARRAFVGKDSESLHLGFPMTASGFNITVESSKSRDDR